MSGSGFRVSIPSNMRKTIENIKEITGNHSDEEIYAMLKECSMDPNETTQKLLLQDPFHEVKSKRERRKKNANNRESVESRRLNGTQGWGIRGGRTNFSPRHALHDVGGRNSGSEKDDKINQVFGKKGVSQSLLPSQDTKTQENNPVTSSTTVVANGPTSIATGSATEITSSFVNDKGIELPTVSNRTATFGVGTISGEQSTVDSSECLVSKTPAFSSAVCSSSSGSVVVPSNDSWFPGKPKSADPVESKSCAEVSEISSSSAWGKISSKSQENMENQLNDFSQSSTATHDGSSISWPNNRPQQTIGPQKVAPNKEWKPKLLTSVSQSSRAVGKPVASEVTPVTFEATAQAQPASKVLDSEEATSNLQQNMEELNLQRSQLVILPNHIHVPESERTKLTFGSFSVGYGITSSCESGPESDKIPTSPASETFQGVEETEDELASSNQNTLGTSEELDYPDHPQSPTHVPENVSSGDGDVTSSAIQEYNDLKQDTSLSSGGPQFSVVHTSPNYGFGLVPPVVGSQIAPFENTESQARDVSHIPNFVVQQPFDPASYYAQFYHSGADGDGRISPFPSSGVATQYNGNVAVLPPSSSQSPQEGGVLPTGGPTASATQVAGLIQSSIAMTQQPVPVFRPPTGLHISHYRPNYIPYGHYIAPFYVPPPPIHQFLGNNAFPPQQAQAGSIYAAPPPAAIASVKYSLPQYKPGTNSGNSTHIGVSGAYGPYGSSQSGYNPTSAATAGNSTTNDDRGGSQFKESNIYITGPQSDSSTVWVAAPGREISSLPTSSFYNLPPQGQHVSFTPTQAGHGSFANIYHPAQAAAAANMHPLLPRSQAMAGAVDMAHPGGGIYQQPQHSQINWPSNY